MTNKRPKYKVGDKVLVEVEIFQIVEDWDTINGEIGYSLINDSGMGVLEGDIDERVIISLAPVVEPTKVNTVVVVANTPWVREDDDEGYNWAGPHVEERTWEQLLIEGTPKIVWEPKE